MSKEKRIEKEELFGILYNTINGADFDDLNEAVYKIADVAGYRKQSEGEWIERPDLQGFICSNDCGELLTELEVDATLPKFCPNCGTKMKNGTTIQEHVEILCKRFCRMKGGGE